MSDSRGSPLLLPEHLASGEVQVRTTDFFTEYSAAGYKVSVYNRGVYDGYDGDASFQIDGKSVLTNKFEKAAGDPRRSLRRYDEWIRGEGGKKHSVQLAIKKMWMMLKARKRIGLECHCHPRPCHGETLAMVLLEFAQYERMT